MPGYHEVSNDLRVASFLSSSYLASGWHSTQPALPLASNALSSASMTLLFDSSSSISIPSVISAAPLFSTQPPNTDMPLGFSFLFCNCIISFWQVVRLAWDNICVPLKIFLLSTPLIIITLLCITLARKWVTFLPDTCHVTPVSDIRLGGDDCFPGRLLIYSASNLSGDEVCASVSKWPYEYMARIPGQWQQAFFLRSPARSVWTIITVFILLESEATHWTTVEWYHTPAGQAVRGHSFIWQTLIKQVFGVSCAVLTEEQCVTRAPPKKHPWSGGHHWETGNCSPV